MLSECVNLLESIAKSQQGVTAKAHDCPRAHPYYHARPLTFPCTADVLLESIPSVDLTELVPTKDAGKSQTRSLQCAGTHGMLAPTYTSKTKLANFQGNVWIQTGMRQNPVGWMMWLYNGSWTEV